MPMATASTERTRLTRRNVLSCVLVAPAVVAGARGATAADPVSVGMVNTISDAGFFVAEAKGYFKAAGIDDKFSRRLPLVCDRKLYLLVNVTLEESRTIRR